MKPIEKLKNGEKVFAVLKKPMMFDEIRRATFLETKELQQCLMRLQKNGYVEKNDRGQWNGIKPEEAEEG